MKMVICWPDNWFLRWQDWIAFEELHRPLFREHGAIYFSNVNKPSKDMNYAFCEVCSLFSLLEWPFLHPNFPQFGNLVTHLRLLSFECILLAVFSHPHCYLGYIPPPGGGGGGAVLGLIFAEYLPLASQSPYPIIVYSVASYRPYLSHFWANT